MKFTGDCGRRLDKSCTGLSNEQSKKKHNKGSNVWCILLKIAKCTVIYLHIHWLVTAVSDDNIQRFKIYN